MLTLRADIAGHEQTLSELPRQARRILQFFDAHRGLMRLVDTRQKWLLLHIIADVCREPANGAAPSATSNRICEQAAELGIASRNTALGFINQLIAYRHLLRRPCDGDRRMKLLSLPPTTIAALADWARLHLVSENASPCDAHLLEIHRQAVRNLLDTRPWLNPPLDVRLAQDMRGGWLLMQEILRHIIPVAQEWIPAHGFSAPRVSSRLGLSRSTLYRLIRMSVEAGIMRWQEDTGLEGLEVNRYHLMQYLRWNDRQTVAYRLAAHERSMQAPSTLSTVPSLTLVPRLSLHVAATDVG